jgi:hypothetical protein
MACRADLQDGTGASGTCLPVKPGTEEPACKPECSNQSFKKSTCGPAKDGKSSCVATYDFCGANGCDAAMGGCLSGPCAADSACDPSAFCAAGKCTTKRTNGAGCAGDGECAEGHCVDGVCCDTACTGTCQSCLASAKGDGSASGICGSVAFDAKPTHGDCGDERPTCGHNGRCDGLGQCAFYEVDTECGGTTCADGVQVLLRCTSGKKCAPRSEPCQKDFACLSSSGMCATACTTKDDCRPGYSCNTVDHTCVGVDACLSATTFRFGAGERACKQGRVCRSEAPASCADSDCTSTADCLPGSGLVCRADGTCAAPVPASDPDAACGCRAPRTPTGPAAPALVLLAAAAWRGRRRARSLS